MPAPKTKGRRRSRAWARPRCRSEEAGGDDVLDLRRARQGVHGEGEGAQGDGAGIEALGDVGRAEQLGGEGVDGEGDDEERHAAVGEHGADEHNGEHGVAWPESG